MTNNLITVKDLYVEYSTKKGFLGKNEIVHAVNGVSLEVKKGEILALAGESGCGKSTLARTILKLEKIKNGQILFNGLDITSLSKEEYKSYRQKAQMIFQNPYSSLNPKMKIGEILREPLDINTNYSKEKRAEIIKEKLEQVGLNTDCISLYPHEFSGGQRQRIAIARSLVLSPEFILADEPVSALDVSIQAQIINLLHDLKEKYNLTFLLITHDMSVIKYLADRVAIMYLGEIVEIGTTEEIFENPKHPYTKALLNAVPKFDGKKNEKSFLQGEISSPTNLPSGCKFQTRCPECMEKCKNAQPISTNLSESHCVKCFLYQD